MQTPLFIIVTLVISSLILAVVLSYYQRETTGIEDKYRYRPGVDIDLLYRQLTQIAPFPGYSDNTNPFAGSSPIVNLGPDSDNDGISDIAELALGTNIFNPDSDNDGSSDNAEQITGTDPLDPTSGGTKLVYTGPSDDGDDDGDDSDDNDPLIPPVIIVKLEKKVKNVTQNTPIWQDYIIANKGDSLAFKITFSLTNDSDIATISTMTDHLGTGLIYTPGSGKLYFGLNTPINLPDAWVLGYPLQIGPNIIDSTIVEINFNATVQTNNDTSIITRNHILLQTANQLQTDNVFIRIK